MSHSVTVIGLVCFLALGGGGIAVALMTASTLGIALMVPGFLSGAKPQAQRRVK